MNNCGACGMACAAVSNGSPGCSGGHCIIASCNVGFDDCDKAILNGCETTVGNDAANCGKCGNACKPFSNGLPTCVNGMCGSICGPGYDDCDHNLMTGCEIDTTLDIAHCGGCGRTCNAPGNAMPAGDQAKCSYRCKLGFSDCDGNSGNGCEVDANKDSSNCGHCGNICPLRPNASAAGCSAGQCTNTCNQGFGDCDRNAFNGCESDFAISLAACGACGKICSNANATPTCSMGVCTLQCKPGYLDCNNDTTDGCEAQLLFDAKNCGACGMVCPQNAAFCVNGVCGSSTPSS